MSRHIQLSDKLYCFPKPHKTPLLECLCCLGNRGHLLLAYGQQMLERMYTKPVELWQGK